MGNTLSAEDFFSKLWLCDKHLPDDMVLMVPRSSGKSMVRGTAGVLAIHETMHNLTDVTDHLTDSLDALRYSLLMTKVGQPVHEWKPKPPRVFTLEVPMVQRRHARG